jgi:hypothetical protein
LDLSWNMLWYSCLIKHTETLLRTKDCCTHSLYFETSSTAVTSEPAPHRLLTFHVPNLMSIFLSLCTLPKESSQFQSPFNHLLTCLFFLRWGVAGPITQPLSSRTNPCWLSATAYSIYSHLEVISSIQNLRTCHATAIREPHKMVHLLSTKLNGSHPKEGHLQELLI